MKQEEFSVKTVVFEGPLELLLELIEKRKLHISDISLAEVTDEYMSHVERLEQFPTREAAGFVLIASTLLLIKSRSLLPGFEISGEEEADIEDLERRLEVYREMKRFSRHVSERFGRNMIFGRENSMAQKPLFVPHISITKASLYKAAESVISALPKIERLSRKVVEKVISLEEMIENLTRRVEKNLKLRFSDIAKGSSPGNMRENKLNLIVGFLALLELAKRGMVIVRQEKTFSDIEFEIGLKPGVPDYS